MTEKEKRDSGLLYDANYDETFLKEMDKCKDMCFEYNALRPSQWNEKRTLIKKIFGKTGEVVTVQAPFWCDYGYNIEVGENFYMNHGGVILDGAKVKFGNNVFVAPGCGFYTAGHPLNVEQRNKGLEYAYPITVGNNVWFGGGVQVLPGVTIGNNVVIGAGSVVTKDIPGNVIAVGNPCRILRTLEKDDIPKEYLQEDKLWN